MEKAIETVKRRAELFTCSYKTAWKNYMEEDEKQGFTIEQITYQIIKGGKSWEGK